jgi:molybdopterin converting factor subunit 1
MIIRLLYFASFRDAVGADEETREVPRGTTVRDLWRDLQERVPLFASFATAPPAAVNADWAAPGRVLADRDDVAFLPPVAGG